MGWFNDLLVKVGIKEAPKPKRKYVRKAPAVKKPKAEKKAAAANVGDAQGKMDLGSLPNKDPSSLASRGDGRHPMDSYLNGGGESHGIR